MYRGFGKMGYQKFPNRMIESGPIEFGRYGAQYDWDAGYGITLNGSNVSAWKDRIQGRTWIQTTAGNQPQFNSADANFNNQPSVQTPVNNRFMVLPSGQAVVISFDFWIASVIKVDVLSNLNQNYILGFDAGAIILAGAIGMGGNAIAAEAESNIGYFLNNLGTGYADTGFQDASPHIVIWTPNSIFVDGVKYTPILGGTGTLPYRPQVSFGCLFRFGSNGRNMIGRTSRLIIGNQALSDASILELSDALNSKYAIY